MGKTVDAEIIDSGRRPRNKKDEETEQFAQVVKQAQDGSLRYLTSIDNNLRDYTNFSIIMLGGATTVFTLNIVKTSALFYISVVLLIFSIVFCTVIREMVRSCIHKKTKAFTDMNFEIFKVVIGEAELPSLVRYMKKNPLPKINRWVKRSSVLVSIAFISGLLLLLTSIAFHIKVSF